MTPKEKAEELHKSVNTFFLSCIDRDGYPMTKAVVPAKHRNILKEIYFCTNTSSKFVAAIASNSKSNVYFYTRKLVWKGCMLKGSMEIVSDLSIKQKFWQNKFKGAYPQQSYTDPDFCVLRFTPISGRFNSWYKSEDFEV